MSAIWMMSQKGENKLQQTVIDLYFNPIFRATSIKPNQ